MPGKKSLHPYTLINAVSTAATITSAPFNIQTLDDIGVQLEWTGTTNGTFSILVSNDYNQQLGTGNFRPLTLSSTPAAVGSADGVFIDLSQLSAAWMKVKFTRTSGTGALTASVSGKAI